MNKERKIKSNEKGLMRNKKGNGVKTNTILKPQPVQKREPMIRKVVTRKKAEHVRKERQSNGHGDGKHFLKTYQISSTPLSTPLKYEKLKNPKASDNQSDSLSEISKTSSRSSVCSSVSSGLIELLCNYNSENLGKEGKESSKDVGEVEKDETLKNDATFSFVIPTDQPNCDSRLKLLVGLLGKLRTTVNSIVSSGDSKSVKYLEKIVETMEKEFSGLQKEIPALWLQKHEIQSEIESATVPLKNENAALQRKLRILNQTLAEKERKIDEKDINLELETVRCMNDTLMEQIKKLSSLLQQLQDEKKEQDGVLTDLRRENKTLKDDVSYKNTEFTKSQEIFSAEAGTIKIEVASALQKVDALKRQLCQAETQGELMKISLNEKDDEISRLNDLNKGLQSSVSRLLEDLRKASRPHNRPSNAPSNEVSSAFLKNLQNVLNTPQNHHNSGILRKPQHLFSFTNSFPPPSKKENIIFPQPEYIVQHEEDFLSPSNFDNILESSRLSSLQASTSPYGSQCYENPRILNGSSTATKSTKPTLWEQSSVSSSFVSFTTRDENDFANNLAILDADIQRLQESLHDRSGKTT